MAGEIDEIQYEASISLVKIFHYMVGLFNCMLLEPEDFSKKVAIVR